VDRKFEKSALILFLALAKNGDEPQLPVAAVVAAAAVIAAAETGGPAPYNVEPIPSLYLQDWDWRLPFLQKI
jgi:hypothetical protein